MKNQNQIKSNVILSCGSVLTVATTLVLTHHIASIQLASNNTMLILIHTSN
ncbi:hypothetical protein DAI22_02g318900 [Oryza sativa Japonica Group]|nr:hypothetical protein DAI22_02g318900 [Oryza sativa Japonica Group]